jgi:hypothetical protein
MSDTLANVGATPASPSPSPAPAPSSPPASTGTAGAGTGPRPSAPLNPRSVGHSPARDTYEQIRHAQDQARGEAPPPPTGDQPQPPADAGAKVKIGKYEISETELGEMMQRQAVEDQRRLTMPTKPEEYKAELPADLKLPGNQ